MDYMSIMSRIDDYREHGVKVLMPIDFPSTGDFEKEAVLACDCLYLCFRGDLVDSQWLIGQMEAIPFSVRIGDDKAV